MRKHIFVQLFVLTVIFLGKDSITFADTSYTFNCTDSKINASIKYSVVGRYQANFTECSGTIIMDNLQNQIKSVNLEIKTESIVSNCDWCDKIVLSPRLLDSKKYPAIIFNGKNLKMNDSGYTVLGSINLHGVTKDLPSQFSIEEIEGGNLTAKGKWVIQRKDFKITWNKILDHGGVLVGDHITVDWEIQAKKNKES